jgi:hypothetical protein
MESTKHFNWIIIFSSKLVFELHCIVKTIGTKQLEKSDSLDTQNKCTVKNVKKKEKKKDRNNMNPKKF